MIWFACRQCDTRQGRPDEEAGTLIFCKCGTSNRVPWESSVEAPVPQPVGWVESSEPTESREVDTPRSGSAALDPPPITFVDDSPRPRYKAGTWERVRGRA